MIASELQLYPYQTDAIESLRVGLRRGVKRQILCAPTGSGKTEMATYLIQEVHEKGKRATFVVDRRTLVDQTSQRFFKYGIPHGVAMASDTFGRSQSIQVASAQTIEKRGYWNELDLLVIDECHVLREKILDFAKQWGGPVIGLSATPLTEGLSAHYEAVVNATTTDKLLEDQYLAPLRIYAAKEIDMKGAKKTAGEWQAGEVQRRGRVIIGDIVSEWVSRTQQHFGGPVKTLLFSADVAHGEELCRAFQLAGYDFRQSSYHDDDATTRHLVNGFKRGDFTGLVSVEKFVKGFDVPDVLCMVGARPYSSSLAAVIQQLGRGMRTASGKDYCLYLDHAGNMAGWYQDICEVWANGVESLPGPKADKQRRKEGKDRLDVVCLGCGFVIPPGAQNCPYCGLARKRQRSKVEKVRGAMEEVGRNKPPAWAEDEDWVWGQVCRLAIDKRGDDVEAARKTAGGAWRGIYGNWPPTIWQLDPCDGPADPRVAATVKRNLIAYFKRKNK